MAITPRLSEENTEYIVAAASELLSEAPDRPSGSEGERAAAHFYLNELRNWCDDAFMSSFRAHPSSAVLMDKILSILSCFNALLFLLANNIGEPSPAVAALILTFISLCVFSYKYMFDGKFFDQFFPKKVSHNVFAKRLPSCEALDRVVFVTRADAPRMPRFPIFGTKTHFVFRICSLIGNVVLFLTSALFLYCGAPKTTLFFNFMSAICIAFIFFFVISVIIKDPKKTSSGLNSGIVPSLMTTAIMKQIFENGKRCMNTELCCLITGSEYSSREGAYAFAAKNKHIFRDIPTTFICIDEISAPGRLCILKEDGVGNEASREIISILTESAENLGITVTQEKTVLRTASFTPFRKAHFDACTIGTSKRRVSKSVSSKRENVSRISARAVSEAANILLESLNYFDDSRIEL